MSAPPTALVLGGLGIIGRNLIQHLEATGCWRVKAVSRRAPEFPTQAEFVPVDLLDPAALAGRADHWRGVTHVFFAAYQEHASAQELSRHNVAMLRHTVEAVERAAGQDFQHVTFIQGGKAYGAHFGIYKTPAKETDPRHFPPNFYYDQEDYLRAAARGKSWTWTALRPDIVIGFALGNPMNLGNLIAVYASLCRELGVPLRFPGPPEAYQVLVNVTDARLLARAMEWAATNPACREQIFNVTNGDVFRWNQVFPLVARDFGIDCADPQTFSLTEAMRDKDPVWERLVHQRGLRPHRLADLAAWPFGDFIFNVRHDAFFDVNKARRAGFAGMDLDSGEELLRLFGTLREQRVIP